MKGIFIPEITVEMFRDGCLESIETLMTEGEVYDIEYDPKTAEPESHWIPVMERLPENEVEYLITAKSFCGNHIDMARFATDLYSIDKYDFHDKKGESGWYFFDSDLGYLELPDVVAWIPLPEPYQPKEESE